MAVVTRDITFQSKGKTQVIDITQDISDELSSIKIKNGIVTLFVPGSTASLTTIEYEKGVVSDLQDAVERLFPEKINYKHNIVWDDGNGHSHVRASVLGPSLTIPLVNGSLVLGTWQQIVFIDFDNRLRNRQVIIQIMGDE